MAQIPIVTANLISYVVESFCHGFLWLLFIASMNVSLKRFAENIASSNGSVSSQKSRLELLRQYFRLPLHVGPVIIFVCAVIVGVYVKHVPVGV